MDGLFKNRKHLYGVSLNFLIAYCILWFSLGGILNHIQPELSCQPKCVELFKHGCTQQSHRICTEEGCLYKPLKIINVGAPRGVFTKSIPLYVLVGDLSGRYYNITSYNAVKCIVNTI